jgi:hypothetical protein
MKFILQEHEGQRGCSYTYYPHTANSGLTASLYLKGENTRRNGIWNSFSLSAFVHTKRGMKMIL